MKEQLEQLLTKLNSGMDFVSGQMPALAEEIVKYKLYDSAISLAAFSLLFLVCMGIIYYAFKSEENVAVLFFSLAGALILIGVCVSVSGVIKSKVAPRLVVIETIKEIIKSDK